MHPIRSSALPLFSVASEDFCANHVDQWMSYPSGSLHKQSNLPSDIKPPWLFVPALTLSGSNEVRGQLRPSLKWLMLSFSRSAVIYLPAICYFANCISYKNKRRAPRIWGSDSGAIYQPLRTLIYVHEIPGHAKKEAGRAKADDHLPLFISLTVPSECSWSRSG